MAATLLPMERHTISIYDDKLLSGIEFPKLLHKMLVFDVIIDCMVSFLADKQGIDSYTNQYSNRFKYTIKL